MTETDAQLVHRSLNGSRAALQTLLERHRRFVTAVAVQTLDNHDDAMDVAQEVLVYVAQRLPELRQGGRFIAWLRHITISLCVDYRRRRGTRRLGEPIALLNEESEEKDYVKSIGIRQALTKLSDAHRSTLLLHYGGGWTIEEVASILSIPINTVRSRLMAGKRSLKHDLYDLFEREKPMPAIAPALDTVELRLIERAYPDARVLSVTDSPEAWMPFYRRAALQLADGSEANVDFRADLDAARIETVQALERLGIPGPRLIAVSSDRDLRGESLCLCQIPRGENLSHWALGGTPHRIRSATERAFQAIDSLEGVTDALLAGPVGTKLKRRTLTDEVEALTSDGLWNAHEWLSSNPERHVMEWRQDPWFKSSLARVKSAVSDINDPLVFTNYLHFFPLNYRIVPGSGEYGRLTGFPGDVRCEENPLAEIVNPYGHIGDPLLGLAMVWIYDCYPFVHTGFVEQFLVRRGMTRRTFAPRLALRALQTIARELPIKRSGDGKYWDALHGYVEQALQWMG